jgi:hypothetical protein
MAKDAKDKKDKDRDHSATVMAPGERGTAGSQGTAGTSGSSGLGSTAGEHHAATAHGRPTQVDTSLPATRPELMALHAAARARRNGSALGSEPFRAAVMDLERIEIRIAAIDRAADPPLG